MPSVFAIAAPRGGLLVERADDQCVERRVPAEVARGDRACRDQDPLAGTVPEGVERDQRRAVVGLYLQQAPLGSSRPAASSTRSPSPSLSASLAPVRSDPQGARLSRARGVEHVRRPSTSFAPASAAGLTVRSVTAPCSTRMDAGDVAAVPPPSVNRAGPANRVGVIRVRPAPAVEGSASDEIVTPTTSWRPDAGVGAMSRANSQENRRQVIPRGPRRAQRAATMSTGRCTRRRAAAAPSPLPSPSASASASSSRSRSRAASRTADRSDDAPVAAPPAARTSDSSPVSRRGRWRRSCGGRPP